MIPKIEPQADAQYIYVKKEAFYKGNFISLMCESFFFAFALTMFSPENVLPVYVSSLSDKAIYIALISALYYGISYSATVFSCVVGVNARSPKWISVVICFLQRIGFFLIFLSTYLASGNVKLALVTFFVSLTLYAGSAGMSNPLFAQMVGTSIHRNVGTFYGAYNMVGACSGVLASVVLTQCLARLEFPFSFRCVFLLGLISALIATVVVCVGVREVTDDRVREKIRLRDIFPIGTQILRENRGFRNYTIIKILVGAAEFAIPYYIITASGLKNVPAGFVGIMATIYLVAKMVGSLVMGRLADRFGAMIVLRVSCICGAVAALLAAFIKDYRLDNPFFRNHCRELLAPYLLQMKEYLAHPERFRLLGVVGVDGSPSCGVDYTSAGNWYGSFSGRKDLEQTLKGARLATGYGIFMDELCKMLREEGLAQRITVTSLFAPEPEKCLSLLEE